MRSEPGDIGIRVRMRKSKNKTNVGLLVLLILFVFPVVFAAGVNMSKPIVWLVAPSSNSVASGIHIVSAIGSFLMSVWVCRLLYRRSVASDATEAGKQLTEAKS